MCSSRYLKDGFLVFRPNSVKTAVVRVVITRGLNGYHESFLLPKRFEMCNSNQEPCMVSSQKGHIFEG